MKKVTKLLLASAFVAVSLQPASAAVSSAGLGFDILGSYYMPTDTRYQGIGSGYALNIKMDDSLTMGYRVEELNVRAEDKLPAGTVLITDNHTVIFQGITAYYKTLNLERLTIDFGLWMGAATTGDFNSAGTTAMTSPFLAPTGRITYISAGKIDTHATVGVAYRFVRKFNLATPFGAGSPDLRNFDGMEITFGVGLAF